MTLCGASSATAVTVPVILAPKGQLTGVYDTFSLGGLSGLLAYPDLCLLFKEPHGRSFNSVLGPIIVEETASVGNSSLLEAADSQVRAVQVSV